MIPNQLLPLLYGDDYLGEAGTGVVVAPRRAIIGKVRTVPRIRGVAEVVSRICGEVRVRPRLSSLGGTVVSNEAALFAAAKQALFQDPWSTLADATGFIARFVAIINNPDDYPANFVEYLLTEGWEYDISEAPEGSTLDARHLLYWLDFKLKEHKALIGYTDRLSEAGWGSAGPTTLSQADPLGLVATLESLNCNIAIIDPQAVDDGDATSRDGPVIVTYQSGSNNTCTLLDGTTAKNGPLNTDRLFTDANKTTFQFRLWGGNGNSAAASAGGLKNTDETGGSSSTRFGNSTKPCIVLVRYATTHVLRKEISWEKRVTNAPAYILPMGYPGELPIVRMGSSTTGSDASPSAVGASAMITVGGADAAKARMNVHLRNVELWGNRDSDAGGGALIFAPTLIYYHSAISANLSSGSIRHCVFRKTQFIRPDDLQAGSYPHLVDAVWATRSASYNFSAGVFAECDGFVFDSNYVEPVAKAVWRAKPDNYTSFDSGWLMIARSTGRTHLNQRVTRNTFAGVKTNSMIVCGTSTNPTQNLYIADNHVEVYDKVGIDVFNAQSGAIIERNRCHDYGNATYSQEGGGTGIQITNCAGFIVRNNVVFNHETAISGAIGIAISTTTGTTENGQVYGNIVYRGVIRMDDNTGGGNLTGMEIYNNLCAGMTEARKATNHTNAPIHVELTLAIGTLEGNVIRDNNIWRFANATPAQATIEAGPHLGIRTTGAGNTYEVTDTLTGWTGNTKERPVWIGDPEADDFRLSRTNSFASWFPSDMPFTASLSKAWTAA